LFAVVLKMGAFQRAVQDVVVVSALPVLQRSMLFDKPLGSERVFVYRECRSSRTIHSSVLGTILSTMTTES
jgi:hypothetical protein